MSAFAKATNARVQGDDVVFELETDGVTRLFEISGDALRRYFGATNGTGSELLRAFDTAEERIRALAKKTQWVPADGTIKLGAGDFDDR